MDGNSKKRGRPKIVVNEAVMQRRRLAKQKSNASRIKDKSSLASSSLNDNIQIACSGKETNGSSTNVNLETSFKCKRKRVEDCSTNNISASISTKKRTRSGGSSVNDMSEPTLGSSSTSGLSKLTLGKKRTMSEGSSASGLSEPTLKRKKTRSEAESSRRRTYIEKRKKAFANNNIILNMGKQDKICGFCHAAVWAAEFTGRHVGNGPKGYSLCCGKGKVQLPLLHETPSELNDLLTAGGTLGAKFRNNIRLYNNMFAFTSFGGNVDDSINNGSGPYVFRLNGQTYHSMGSLLPPSGCTPKFAQFYMYDGQEAIDNRLQFPGRRDDVNSAIVASLLEMLNRENILVGIFRQLRDRFHETNQVPVRIRLLEKRSTDGRFVSTPTGNEFEFAGLALDDDFANHRDIIIEHQRFGLQRISELHPSFMSLQYPLLFPHGEDGYRIDIPHRNVNSSDRRRRKSTVSMREYQAYRIQYRTCEGQTLLRGGRLFLQYVVDAWCCVERGRLQWVRKNQSVIRSDLYNNIVDSVRRGDVSAADVGKRIILPSSFTGGYRYMQQNFQDSLAVCKEYGHPDLFITFTCNPKWDEIQSAVEFSGTQDASVRPDIVARVFKMKLEVLMSDLMKKDVLGRALAVVYTVEFQKRGLPHVHIVLWLCNEDKLITPEEIDTVISAEIPDMATDIIGYKAVSQFMMHGPCGEANPRCPCMVNGKCKEHYPRSFNNNTFVNDDGYALYRRRDTKQIVECKKIFLDNRHVVPYNRGLLVKYQGHINVEWCNHSQSIKYLFKYIGKGPDTSTIVMESSGEGTSNMNRVCNDKKNDDFDEINNYLSCRYVSAAEACWRLFEFPIHHREPFVQRLFFHLENEQEIRFRDDETLPEVCRRVDPDGTMFIQWMLSNRYDESGRHLTFVKYPTKFCWDGSAKRWFRRKQCVDVVGRMVYAHPTSGERFYMRLLLNFVTGVESFEDIRTVNGIVYPTYKEACFHRGLLDSDKEWHIAIDDASICANASQLRDLFVTLLVFCEVTNPGELWEKHWTDLSDDIEYTRRRLVNSPTLKLSDSDKQMLALDAINNLLKQYGKSLLDYPGLPTLDQDNASKFKNQLLLEEMLYDRHQLQFQASQRVNCLNQMQRAIFEQIMRSIASGIGGLYFVYGHGGTGKTFLWSTIIAKLRSEGKIVLAVASSGIASLLIEGGRTAHSRFKIPIDVNEFSSCEIKKNTHLAELICKTSLIVWDEASMNHRFVFEAVDRTFRDILVKINPNANSLPFGGLTMLLGGDFRQVLPVVPKKGREDIVGASISKSHLWQHCVIFPLLENMRVDKDVPEITINGRKRAFRDWVLSVGDGTEQCFNLDNDNEPSWIRIPDEIRVNYSGDAVAAIVNEIYGELNLKHGDIEYLRDRAILTPLNEFVDKVNREVLKRLPGESTFYKSCDSICKGSSTNDGDEVLYPPEYLNSLKFSGMPNHEIEIKLYISYQFD